MKLIGKVAAALWCEECRQILLGTNILKNVAMTQGVPNPYEFHVLAGRQIGFEILLTWKC
ncbi:hypothetical protein SAMN05216264_1061 [Pseudomonas marincola]|nr:hypothetical protein SAMN05216264_1061 [Pseudomonas marincola]